MSERPSVLFIHGGGDRGYEVDAALASSLQERLGAAYRVHYPRMAGGDDPPSEFMRRIGAELAALQGDVIVVAHSVGASLFLKYLAGTRARPRLAGIFLLATPFWGGEHEGFVLPDDFAEHVPKDVPLFLFHCRDDAEVPFAHLARYAARLPWATARTRQKGGHQFDNDLTRVARDIRELRR